VCPYFSCSIAHDVLLPVGGDWLDNEKESGGVLGTGLCAVYSADKTGGGIARTQVCRMENEPVCEYYSVDVHSTVGL
jgi:hypothetical protein